ncbi:HAD-IIB family hydrolase [soil metagenome]
MKKLVAFDLDGTLAQSKQPIADSMGKLLAELLAVVDVAVISGGDWPQFEKQVIARLPKSADVKRLYIMPTTGSKLYRATDGKWSAVYADNFTKEEGQKIRAALDKAVSDAGLKGEKIWGEQIEDRGSQITFSGLGQEAPLDAKSKWDPDQKKRQALQTTLRKALPDLSINTGGATSVDITQKGVDKAYAMHRLAKESGVAVKDMLFMGDATYPGGNDAPVPEAGMDTITVRDAQDTETAIAPVIACLKP